MEGILKHCMQDIHGYISCRECTFDNCNDAIIESAEQHDCLIAMQYHGMQCQCGNHE